MKKSKPNIRIGVDGRDGERIVVENIKCSVGQTALYFFIAFMFCPEEMTIIGRAGGAIFFVILFGAIVPHIWRFTITRTVPSKKTAAGIASCCIQIGIGLFFLERMFQNVLPTIFVRAGMILYPVVIISSLVALRALVFPPSVPPEP